MNLLPEEIDTAVDEMCTANAIFLGEHHNSLVDHALQARIVDSLQKRCARGDRKLAIGLEMVQTQFQDVLDMFVAGEIGEEQMFIGTEWDTRWVWPFETYLPLLRVARKYKIPLVALSIDSDTLSRIRERGIEALSGAEVQRYVGDAQVFSDMMKERAFKQYISECITPSYAAHYRLGLLQETKNFETFYTSRVMRDEVMATNVARYIRRTGCLMVTVVGADHVKFEYGVTGRVERQLRDVYEQPSVKTIMLNPSPADAFDARDGSLKLEMTVGNDAIPIADYLWFSSISSAKPRRRVRERKLPPVERLTSR